MNIHTKNLILTLILLTLGACQNQKKPQEKTSKKPNIIYILADDLGYGDLSFTGQQKFKTPNIKL